MGGFNPDLIKLDNHDTLDSSIAQTIETIEQKREEQYNQYIDEVLEKGSKSINDAIKRNNYPVLNTPLKKVTTNAGRKIKEVKSNFETFARLIAIMQEIEVSLDLLFSHEFLF